MAAFKLTILWSALASYSVAFFRELALSQNFRIHLVYRAEMPDAPYDPFDLTFCEHTLALSSVTDHSIDTLVAAFRPDCVLMTSWAYPSYMQITRKLRRGGTYVVSVMDNAWHGTLKQYFGIISSPFYLWPSIDTFLVAGDRQAAFARKLGYNNILYGCYAAEVERFSCDLPIANRPRAFLFVGRLVPEKNISELVRAYRRYRDSVERPWRLRVAGDGVLSAELKKVPGVELLGFVQPNDLPRVMSTTRCLVLPSRWEQWGVVIQEGAAAGLPVIASHECGAVTAYVRDGVNGYVVSPQSEYLAAAMARISQSSEEQLIAMSQASIQLANLWTPRKLAAYVREHVSLALGHPADPHRTFLREK